MPRWLCGRIRSRAGSKQKHMNNRRGIAGGRESKHGRQLLTRTSGDTRRDLYNAPYRPLLRGSELIVSFLTLAEMCQGSLEANWGRASAPWWKHVWPISQSFIRTASCAPYGPPSETRAHKRDPLSVRPTHGLLPRRWSCRLRWSRTIPGTTDTWQPSRSVVQMRSGGTFLGFLSAGRAGATNPS